MRITFLLILTLSVLNVRAQRFNVDAFRALDGLDTDFIKCVSQDQLGYIWIGTDDGLLKYDGNSFTPHFGATKSNYIKDFLMTSDGKLLVIHDLGLTEIINNHDTTIFNDIIDGGRIESDSTLWYPKMIFEDNRRNIWIAEPQSVVKLNDGQWKRYKFSSEYNSNSFIHSFRFAQLNDDSLLISANPGQISVFDYALDSIKLVKDLSKKFNIYSLSFQEGRLLLGTNHGLIEYDIEGNILLPIISDYAFSDIQPYKKNSLIATTESRINFYVEKQDDGTWYVEDIPKTEALTNQVFVADDYSIWLSTEKGLKILGEKDFRQLKLKEDNQFIEALISSNTHDYLYAIANDNITYIDQQSEKSKVIYSNQAEYFLSGTIIDDYLWASTTSAILRLNKHGEIDKRISMADYGRYIFDVHSDSKNMLWIAQEASIGVKKFNPYNQEIEIFDSSRGLNSEITAIASTQQGLYVATTDPNALISYLPNGTDIFMSVLVNIPNEYRSGIVVSELLVVDKFIWLGTNFGLFKLQGDRLVKIDFDSKFSRGMVRVMRFDGENLWLGNAMGLFSINPETLDFSHYDEKSGLPINTINDESIVITDKKVWVGTSQGVSLMTFDEQSVSATAQPFILDVSINREEPVKKKGVVQGLPFNALLDISFSSMTFPANKVYYSYRLDGKEWSRLDNVNSASYTGLSAGDHIFEVRAKKMGNYSWSQPATFIFEVDRPFYLREGFLVLILAIIILLIALTREITRRVEKARNKLLSNLVEKRTEELNQYKDGLERLVGERTILLEKANQEIRETQDQLIHTEKMASLGVLTAGIAHEINNPINYVQGGIYSIKSIIEESKTQPIGWESSTEEIEEVVDNMQIGVDRITRIVSSLSRFSRKDGEQMTPCNIIAILNSCLLILNHEIRSDISINIKSKVESAIIMADEGKIHQLFVNLLSNAVHALVGGGSITIQVVDRQNFVKVRISDTGIGISENNLMKIYDPFFTTKPPGKGTGLGLFISHKVVEDHGGEIKFNSVLGKGTTVFIKLKKNH